VKKLFLLLPLLLLTAAAQDSKPDFSGAWVMNVAKSDFGPLPPTEAQTNVVEHNDPKLNVKVTAKTAQGELQSELSYTTDGEENTNEVRGTVRKSRTRWDNKELVTEVSFENQGNRIKIVDRWTLSDGGRILTVTRAIASDLGDAAQKLIFTRRE